MSDAPMAGFPPPPESVVSVENWQEPPFNRWSFQHLREIVPTQRITRGARAKALALSDKPPALDHIGVTRLGAGPSTVLEVLADTWTDAVIVLHDGQVVLERYFGQMRANTPHLLMSVSKSIVGCVCGILASKRRLDPAAPVTQYIPEIAGSGYDGATVRHLLDMRTGVAFSETYEDPNAEVRVMERQVGWRPGREHESAGLYAYLTSLSSHGPHGGPFVYRSADTDVLGWVCERAAGVRMADLVSTLIWAPIGAEYDAEITCDGLGSAVHDGGVSATARDLARFGKMLLDDGWVGPRRIVPESWLQQARHIDADIRGAFGLRLGAGPAGRLVPQPVLVRPRTVRRHLAVPRHPRPDGLCRPRHPHRRGEALVMAGASGSHPSGRHDPGLRSRRPAPGRVRAGRGCRRGQAAGPERHRRGSGTRARVTVSVTPRSRGTA